MAGGRRDRELLPLGGRNIEENALLERAMRPQKTFQWQP
jgi:hypothetical protein